jgi:ammonium transporter, Amt family
MLGLCSGTIAGLIVSTATAGSIPLWAGFVVGIMGGALCNYGTRGRHLVLLAWLCQAADLSAVKHFLGIDDTLDLFALHGIGGIISLIFNGFFATTDVISLDGINTETQGGFLDHNYKQLYIQFAYACACSGYVFVVTAAIAKVFCLIPLLNLRATDHAESIGIDEDQVRVNYMFCQDLRG